MGSFSNGGSHTSKKNMEQVIAHIMQNQEQHRFSMRFKDPHLEGQFMAEMHSKNKHSMRIPFALIVLMALSVIANHTADLLKSQHESTELYYSLPIVFAIIAQSFIHYKVALTKTRAYTLYTPLQSFLVMIAGLEITFIGSV